MQPITEVRSRTGHKEKNKKVFISAGVIAAGILFTVSVLLILGGQIYKMKHPVYPANQACIDYATTQPANLKAKINTNFGDPIPEGTPSDEDVAKAKTTCFENQDKSANMAVEATK